MIFPLFESDQRFSKQISNSKNVFLFIELENRMKKKFFFSLTGFLETNFRFDSNVRAFSHSTRKFQFFLSIFYIETAPQQTFSSFSFRGFDSFHLEKNFSSLFHRRVQFDTWKVGQKRCQNAQGNFICHKKSSNVKINTILRGSQQTGRPRRFSLSVFLCFRTEPKKWLFFSLHLEETFFDHFSSTSSMRHLKCMKKLLSKHWGLFSFVTKKFCCEDKQNLKRISTVEPRSTNFFFSKLYFVDNKKGSFLPWCNFFAKKSGSICEKNENFELLSFANRSTRFFFLSPVFSFLHLQDDFEACCVSTQLLCFCYLSFSLFFSPRRTTIRQKH